MESQRITVGRRVAALALLAALAGCGGMADPYLTAPNNGGADTTRPTIIGTLPAPNASSVSTGSMIIVTFSETVDSASVTNAAFSLSGGATGTISVSGASAQLVPYPALPANTTITVTVSGVKDLAGNTMAAPYSWSFTTAP
ncbi:MAG: Ig-like domain-containing protein [Gemmatimonadaceae bacterium]|nr:Ig-like domain-containing protein [Gemmatimonadaceae bacterium]NUQ91578.1 Ig-like domain-containing protein [Gemmatimonadaceae bacterium]NUR20640.1 Ig-like domain-containing protein [Gemmatimonadaceae bacterium]NUS96054.1 Ig-like domain-containing protein [Gemmatimonadaceae bacterium]